MKGLNRREFLQQLAVLSIVGTSGCRYWPGEGITNPCLTTDLPASLATHPVIQSAWDGIDPSQFWDCHVHLVGKGDSDSGVYVNPSMTSLWHPVEYAKFQFYLDASCSLSDDDDKSADELYVERLLHIVSGMPDGFKLMLLAFDHYCDSDGNEQAEISAFHTPNKYASELTQQHPDKFEWIASIHPYRSDSVTRLKQAATDGARAVKWLPSAMGIDPSSKKCDLFYETLAGLNMPLLAHTGSEDAVDTPGGEDFGNPLIFRRPLDHGVKVIFSHCSSTGESIDIDKGSNAAKKPNFELFTRMLNEKKYENFLFADISAITQINRDKDTIAAIIENDQWHHRYIFGSDYPLPGVMPLLSTGTYEDWGWLSKEQADVMKEVRKYNVIHYDFLLKRHLNIAGKQFAPQVFQTKDKFSI